MFGWFERLVDAFPAEKPKRPPSTLVAFCWHYTRDVWPFLLAIALLTAAISIIQVMMFSFLGNIVDWLAAANRETFLADEGAMLAWMAFVVLIALPAASLLRSLFMHQTILGNFPMRIRWQAHRYLLGQSFGFYQDEFAGRIATKVMQAALGVRETVTKILDVLTYVVVYFAGALVLMATFDFILALPFLLWLSAYIVMLRYFLPKMRAISERQADARSTMTGRIVDTYTNIMTVKLFAHGGRELDYARDSMDQFLDTVHPQMRLATKLNVGLDLLNVLLLFAVSCLSLWLWLGGATSVGMVAVGIGLVLRLEGMSHWIMWELSSLFENIGMAHDGMTTIAQPQTVTDRDDAKRLVVDEGRIRFENVTFNYGKDKGIIEGLNLEIEPGEKVGLIGRSGAGKSTLVNLLLRFYDLEDGRITVDGQDIATVTQDSLRSHVGMVTQDTSLLHRSVRDNILYGRPVADDQAMVHAAERAEAIEFISELEDVQGRRGFDAHVGERGVKLSGGQRQRIAIARVMLKDAPILILDEATSALDSEVEAAIQENLYRLMEGKTVIAIAHRLSTIAAMDRLVVMDNGAIIESGSHDELVARGGLYAQLWERQSGGFLLDETGGIAGEAAE